MSEKEKYRRADEYLKYLKGELSERERHAFERDMEADPFLREALEGLEKITPGEAEEALLGLHDRLRKRVHRRRRIAIYSAAAAVASLLIIGTVFLQIHDFTPDEGEVTRLEQEAPFREPPVLSRSDDSEEASAGVTAAAEDEAGRGVTGPEQEGVSEPATADEPIIVLEAEPKQQPVEKSLAREESRKKSGEVQDADRAAEPEAGIAPADRAVEQPALQKRVSGIRVQRAQDNIPEEQMEETLQFQVTSFPDEGSSGEIYRQGIVTFGFDSGDKDTLSYTPSELDRQAGLPGFARAKPEGGYTVFSEYLKDNMQLPSGAGDSLLRTMEIRFTIRGDGRPENIEPLAAPPGEIMQEVTRLLKRGPVWNYSNDAGETREDSIRIRILY